MGIIDFFTRLLSGNSPEGDAAAGKEALIESVAVLERARAMPDLPREARDAVAGLARLLFLCINMDPMRMAREKDAILAIRSFTGKIAERMRKPGTHSREDVAALLVEGRELAIALVDILEAAPPEAAGTPGAITGLRERLAIAEARDMANALTALAPGLPSSMAKSLDRIHALAGDILAHCEKTGTGVARECKFLKKYIAAARTIAEGTMAMKAVGPGQDALGQDEMAERTGEILERIAAAFESEKKALATRGRDDFAADLSVLDTLLRMDGK